MDKSLLISALISGIIIYTSCFTKDDLINKKIDKNKNKKNYIDETKNDPDRLKTKFMSLAELFI